MAEENTTAKNVTIPMKSFTPYLRNRSDSEANTVNTSSKYSNLRLHDMVCNTARE